jgi:hypothetical protein
MKFHIGKLLSQAASRVYSARIYRPRFRENKLKTLVFNDLKRAVSAYFRDNWVYKLGHWGRAKKKTSRRYGFFPFVKVLYGLYVRVL